MTLFIIHIIEGILLAILITYNLYQHLLSGPTGTCETTQLQRIQMVALSRPASTICTTCSPLSTYATDFYSKMWYDSIEKCILQIFLRQILVQVVKNGHENIFIMWQIKG